MVIGTLNSVAFAGTYSVNKEQETYSYEVNFVDGTSDRAQNLSYSVSGNSLSFTFRNSTVSAASYANSNSQWGSSVVGNWVSQWMNYDGNYRRFVTFKADNTFVSDLEDYGEGISPYDRGTGTWRTYGNTFEVKWDGDPDTYTYNYSVSNGVLTWRLSGNSMKWYKIPE